MMLGSVEMTIKNLGLTVENAWKKMRPMTKEMLVGMLKPGKKSARKQNFSYDAHADWEISRLLDALDKQAESSKENKSPEPDLTEIASLAEACTNVLEERTESAETFIKLAKRALLKNDFHKFDQLSGMLLERFSASEVAEIIRQTGVPQISAISYETLAVMPTSSIAPLLKDPLYFEIGCNVLDQQAIEFENQDARRMLEQMDASNFLKL